MTYHDISNESEYRDMIAFHADCVLEEYEPDAGMDMMDITEMVERTADDHTIYTHDNLDVLYHSPTQPEEWTHMVNDGSSWQDVVQAMAYDIFRQDLYAEINSRDIDQ